MITVTWFGGPYDGAELQLRHCGAFDVAILLPPQEITDDEAEGLSRCRRFTPELTANGWVVRWREN